MRALKIGPIDYAPATDRIVALRVPRRALLSILILATALWGIVVDSSLVPILTPSGNSTLVQATTAAPEALLGILFGPLTGALPGMLRDGTLYLAEFVLHPEIVRHPELFRDHPRILHAQPGTLLWIGRAAADIFEDMIVGMVPGVVGRRTGRFLALAGATFAGTWISLPFYVASLGLMDRGVAGMIQRLTSITGHWNQPVDPGLTVYALFTAGLVSLALTFRSTIPRRSALTGVLLCSAALVLILLGAHS